MRRDGLPALLTMLLVVAACARDISSRELAYQRDGSLYVSHLDGSGAITLSHDVQGFRWTDDGSEIELVTRIFSEDSVATLSHITVRLTDVANFRRDGTIAEQDTLPTPPLGWASVSPGGLRTYAMEGDTLVIEDTGGERRRIAGVTHYALHPATGR